MEISEGAKQLIEDLAELHHNIWIKWSQDIASSEIISSARRMRWEKLWIPYKDLTEEQKEQDRILARKVLQTQWDSAQKQLGKELGLPQGGD